MSAEGKARVSRGQGAFQRNTGREKGEGLRSLKKTKAAATVPPSACPCTRSGGRESCARC